MMISNCARPLHAGFSRLTTVGILYLRTYSMICTLYDVVFAITVTSLQVVLTSF